MRRRLAAAVLLDARWARGALAAVHIAAAELRAAAETHGAWTRSASPASGRCAYSPNSRIMFMFMSWGKVLWICSALHWC